LFKGEQAGEGVNQFFQSVGNEVSVIFLTVNCCEASFRYFTDAISYYEEEEAVFVQNRPYPQKSCPQFIRLYMNEPCDDNDGIDFPKI
jgi:hypothetical protein